MSSQANNDVMLEACKSGDTPAFERLLAKDDALKDASDEVRKTTQRCFLVAIRTSHFRAPQLLDYGTYCGTWSWWWWVMVAVGHKTITVHAPILDPL
jgi:hypothetical protein